MSYNRFTLIFRSMLAALVVAFGLVLCAQAHGPTLSSEARQYSQLVWETQSGLSLAYAAQKVCWLLAVALGGIGIALLFLRFRGGLVLLLLSAPMFFAAAVLDAPPPAYPDIGQTTVVLLECITSALWGSVVTCGLLADRILLPKPTPDAATSIPASRASFWARLRA